MSRDLASCLDIIYSVRQILQYCEGLQRDQLGRDVEKQDAILRRITIIGEATKRLSLDFREQYPDIPWKRMAGMRDIVVHSYDAVNLDRVWSVIQDDLPTLGLDLERLLSELSGSDPPEGS